VPELTRAHDFDPHGLVAAKRAAERAHDALVTVDVNLLADERRTPAVAAAVAFRDASSHSRAEQVPREVGSERREHAPGFDARGGLPARVHALVIGLRAVGHEGSRG
jgi:hypothetical protein